METGKEKDRSEKPAEIIEEDFDWVISSQTDYRAVEDRLRSIAPNTRSNYNIKSHEDAQLALAAYFDNDFDAALRHLSDFEISDKYRGGGEFAEIMMSLIVFKQSMSTGLIETKNLVGKWIEEIHVRSTGEKCNILSPKF